MGSNPMHVARAAEAVIDGANIVNTGFSISLWVDGSDVQRALIAMEQAGDRVKPKAITTDDGSGRVGLKL